MPAVKLSMTEWGSGPRLALILHGVSSNSAGWWRLGPDLAGAGYRVIAPDLRGHGTSPKSPDMLIDDHRDDILELRPHWDLVLGHSLGGAIVLAAVAEAETLTDKLILQDPVIIGSNSPEVLAWLLKDYEVPVSAGELAATNPRWHAKDAEFKAEALRQAGPEIAKATFDVPVPWNYWDTLVSLSVPTLLVGADPKVGALVGPEIGMAAAAENPMIQFETVVGGSHSMHRDEYAAYWDLIRDFAS